LPRGNGESDKPTDPADYTLELMVDDVLAVADTCNAVTFHHLGFSLGAKVGWGVRGGG
jgi:pimeloyl-ACP methyl ester carboxylesterase